MYVLNTHGAGKIECLREDGQNLAGSHNLAPGQFWGEVQYKLIKGFKCSAGSYVLAGRGTACAGSGAIRSKAECQQAALTMGLNFDAEAAAQNNHIDCFFTHD